MKVQKESLPKSRIRLKIEISKEEMTNFLERAFLKLASQIEIKGFRPGKAPRNLLYEKIGQDKIFSEALEIALPETYHEALTDQKLVTVSEPQIKIEKHEQNQPLVYTAEVDVLPQFTLPDYKKTKVTKKEPKIEEKDVQLTLKNLQKSYATFKPISKKAEKGDRVEIDFEGYLDKVKIDQLISKNHPLILGEGLFVPGFEDQLVGMKKGEEKEFKLTLPQNLREKFLAGKEVNFKVKMLDVKEVILPKLDDQFAKSISKFKNLTELKEDVKKALLKRAQNQEQRKLETEILEKIASEIQMELPESLVRREQERMLSDLVRDIEARGLSFKDYLASIKKTEEELQTALKSQAEKTVKFALILVKIKEEEKIKVKDQEIKDEMELLKKSGFQIEDNEQTRRQLENVLGNRKVLAKLVEYTTQ